MTTYRRVSVTTIVSYDVVVCVDDEHQLETISDRILSDLRDTIEYKTGYATDHEPGDVVFACSTGAAFDGGSPDCSAYNATFTFDPDELDPEAIHAYAESIQAQRP